jgi:aminoglycoside-2''-adenylyltransferase
MTAPTLRWEPLRLDEAASLMEGFPGPWWIAAGWAIELHVGSKVREHGDVDVLVLRDDQEAIRAQLSGWDVRIAHDGRLEAWPEGMQVELPRSGLWARADPDGPWQLQFLLAEREGDEWWYRRDPRIRLPLEEIGLRSASGMPYLRPELVLLLKSKHHREEDEADFEAVLPCLDDVACRRLASWLAPGDPWRNRIEGRRVL